MTDTEAHDLLIKIDTRLGTVETHVEEIRKAQAAGLCQTHAEKIKTLEKIVWGSLLLSLSAVFKVFFPTWGGHG